MTGNPVNIQRAECVGLWSWLVFLHHHISYYGIRIAAILHCYCDNQTVVRQSQVDINMVNFNDQMIANYDIINDIRLKLSDLRELNNVTIIVEYLPSHPHPDQLNPSQHRAHILHAKADELANLMHGYSTTNQYEHHSVTLLCALREGDVLCTGNELHRLGLKFT